jgi:parvulin-like peptidyl-prolyl isomerase
MTLYVNGEAVNDAMIEAEIACLRPSYEQVFQDQPKTQQDAQLTAWARENLVERVLFRQLAQAALPEVSEDQVQASLNELLQREGQTGPMHQRLEAGAKEVQKLKDDIADQLRYETLVAQVTRNAKVPTEKDIRAYYEQHLAERFTIPELVHAAHIVKHPASPEQHQEQYEQMCGIKEQLDSGTAWETLAAEHSDCPGNAGDQGFFARGKMVPAFEEVAFNLTPGTYSDVFETEFGWHIVKVFEKRPSIPCPLEQVREVIVRDLTQQAQEKAIEQFLDAQKEKACIEER